MRSLDCFIVKPLGGKRYNNTEDIDGKEFILSSSQEDHTVTNREAIVVGLPLRDYNGPISVGDTVVVPLPYCPYSLLPHAQSEPLDFRAIP